MNKTRQGLDADAKFDNNELDVYSLSEDELWTKLELEEMRRLKSTQGKKSACVLNKTEEEEGGIKKVSPKKGSHRKSQGSNFEVESRPDFYHGVGPYNDVNLPGVWFFRIPHKVCFDNHKIMFISLFMY